MSHNPDLLRFLGVLDNQGEDGQTVAKQAAVASHCACMLQRLLLHSAPNGCTKDNYGDVILCCVLCVVLDALRGTDLLDFEGLHAGGADKVNSTTEHAVSQRAEGEDAANEPAPEAAALNHLDNDCI